MNKRTRLLCLLLLCALLLGGCYSPAAQRQMLPAATLAPAPSELTAPIGLEAQNYEATAALYLPALNGQRLLCQYARVQLNHETHPAEAVVRALLDFRANSEVTTLGGPVALSLYGSHPVEVAGGICTVSLGSSALQLDQPRFYTVCLGLAATLCQLEGIHSVNVLVADQAVGMDITNSLPLGLVTAHPGEDLSVLWTQMESRRPPLGQDPAEQGLSASAALYFPLAGGEGFVAESRTIAFPGQSARQLVQALLSELSAGAAYATGAARMPDLTGLMQSPPEAVDLRDGGRLVTLRFTGDLQARLQEAGVDMAPLMSAVVYTITSFVPTVTAVDVYVGNAPLRRLYNSAYGVLSLQNGRLSRGQFSAFLMERVQICLAEGEQLITVNRWMPAARAGSLTGRLRLLWEGPTEAERQAGISPVLPDTLTEADILGLSLSGDTLVLNLSAGFAQLIRGGAWNERLLCYSMVNTLCAAKSLRRAVFFWEGRQEAFLAGDIYWMGEFLPAPGLSADEQG